MPTKELDVPEAREERAQEKAQRRPLVVAASAILPVLALGLVVAFFLMRGPGVPVSTPAPLENIAFERIEFVASGIRAHVINTGPEAVTIAQVQVGWTNRASWDFHVTPSPTLPRLGRAIVEIPYPWVAGEPYDVALLTASGLIFSHKVDLAAETPRADVSTVLSFALLGVYVGVIPVFLGIGWLPFLRALPQRWYTFLLSLTVGLLAFLAIDSLHEALESAEAVPGPFQAIAIIAAGVLFSILGLYAVNQVMRKRMAAGAGLALAYGVAFGIGVHNLGEGLAIGAAYALGAVSVGAMLIIGFTVHNLTEGVAVVAPVVRSRFAWRHLVWMGLLAGVPTIAGTILGGFTYSPTWAVLFLAIGAGAVLQVVIEIVRYQVRESGFQGVVGGYSLAGFAAGFAVMYLTGLMLTV